MEIILKKQTPRIRTGKIKKTAIYLLKRLGCPENSSLSILLVDNRTIKKLNKKYFNKDRPTNVIAFPMHYQTPPPDRKYLLGDIVLSAEAASEEAEVARITCAERLEQLLIHGMLHLMNYRDNEEKQRRRMEAMEEKLFRAVRKQNKLSS